MTHPYEPCEHPGRHGYTLPGDAEEYAFCERCRDVEGRTSTAALLTHLSTQPSSGPMRATTRRLT